MSGPPPAVIPRGGPVATVAGARDLARTGSQPSTRQRDFLLVTIFVLAQQGFIDRAGVLAEALYLSGEVVPEVMLARAVLRFLAGDWAATLACLEDLDRVDPVERFGGYTLTEPQRARRFLAARCLFELGEHARSRDAVNGYLRRSGGDGQ